MQFREATLADRKQVEALWDCCFEKREEPFFKFYFSKYCWQVNQVFGAFNEAGKLQCMLHLNPYTLELHNYKEFVPYIVGVATAPAARGQHLMGRLMQYALDYVRKQGVNFVTLMPIYAGIYTPYNFAFCYERAKYSWERGKLSLPEGDYENLLTVKQLPAQASPELIQTIAAVYTDVMVKQYEGIAERYDKDWQKLLTSYAGDGVQLALVYLQEKCVGYLCYYEQEQTLHLQELIAYNPKVYMKLLHFADALPLGQRVEWLAEPADKMYLLFQDAAQAPQKLPFMMARCVNVFAAFAKLISYFNECLLTQPAGVAETILATLRSLFAHKFADTGISIGIADELLEDNSVCLSLSVQDKYELKQLPYDPDFIPDVVMDVGDFTQLYFGYASIKDLYSMSKIVTTKDNLEVLKVLETIFIPQDTWNNEYF